MIILIKSIFAIAISLFISIIGYRKNSLSLSGAFCGIIIGFLHAISSFTILISLMTFFVFGSLITNIGKHQKREIEYEFKEGGQRNWIQVFSNGFCSSLACVIYILEVGIQFYDIPINYEVNPIGSMCMIGAISSLAASCGDTFSSEIGSVFSKTDPRLIINFRKVPRGSNGGVSLVGTLSSLLGGFLVGIAAYLCNRFTCNYFDVHDAPPQWPLIIISVSAGFLGSLIDSILGSSFQFTGINVETGKISNSPGPHIKHICGKDILDNHNVNLISSTITGISMAIFALYLWPFILSSTDYSHFLNNL